ncbi:hypothetical protein NDU88_006121 [Pleurodeles waltl]|uniref:Uncharacterized protein n=1 Tax=Pleurodeles waltl TaxID=8319 RepID=A0AAV7NSI8_PLEWA|nr:hypothetical protein NDU88_006121 [Pleurodeles waltl]
MDAPMLSTEPIVISDSDEENNLIVNADTSGVAFADNFQQKQRVDHTELQVMHRWVNSMINKIQRWQVEQERMIPLEVVSRQVFSDKQVVGGDGNNFNLQQVQVEEIISQNKSLESQHRAAEIIQKGCDIALGVCTPGVSAQQMTAAEKRSSFAVPVKVWAPSGHRAEERVVSGASHLTSREWAGESVYSGHRRSTENPTTSRSADLKFDNLFAIHDESLDYEQELEGSEIWDDREHSLLNGTQKGKGGTNFNKERSVGVFQDSAPRMIQCNRICKKDSWLNAVGCFRKGESKKTPFWGQGSGNTKVVHLVSVAVGSSPIAASSKGMVKLVDMGDGDDHLLKDKNVATLEKDGGKDGKVAEKEVDSHTVSEVKDDAVGGVDVS